MRIEARDLKKLHACPLRLRAFRSKWGDGVAVTNANVLRMIRRPPGESDIIWLLVLVLPGDDYARFWRARTALERKSREAKVKAFDAWQQSVGRAEAAGAPCREYPWADISRANRYVNEMDKIKVRHELDLTRLLTRTILSGAFRRAYARAFSTYGVR